MDVYERGESTLRVRFCSLVDLLLLRRLLPCCRKLPRSLRESWSRQAPAGARTDLPLARHSSLLSVSRRLFAVASDIALHIVALTANRSPHRPNCHESQNITQSPADVRRRDRSLSIGVICNQNPCNVGSRIWGSVQGSVRNLCFGALSVNLYIYHSGTRLDVRGN